MRWSLIACCNRGTNVPYNEPSKSSAVPIDMAPDEFLMESKTEGLQESANFLEKEKDEALK